VVEPSFSAVLGAAEDFLRILLEKLSCDTLPTVFDLGISKKPEMILN
jgi:hypothetical protein